MKKTALIALPIATALLFAGAAFAGNNGGTYTAPKASDADFKIDGKLDDAGWAKAPWETVDEFNKAKWQVNGTHVVDATPDNAADASYSFKVAHTDKFLYIAIDVKDDSYNNENDVPEWKEDTIEVYFDGANYGGASHEYMKHVQMRAAAQTPAAEHGRARLQRMGTEEAAWELRDYDPGLIGDTGKVFGNVTKGGYTLEMAIPWDELEYFVGKHADVMGIDFQMNDNDEGGSARQTQLFWSGNGNNWQVPDNFGKLVLAK